MKTMILALSIFFTPLLCFAQTPAEVKDGKAITLNLDKDGNAVSVVREGRYVKLMTREATVDTTDPTVKVFSDGGVRLSRRQALRLTELLDNAIRGIAEPREEAVENAKAPWLHLCANQCGPNGCRVNSAPRRAPAAPTTCGPSGCSTGACGQRSYANYSRPRIFRRLFGRRCCR